MSSVVDENKRLFREFTNEVYNKHQPESARDYLAPDIKWHAAQLGTLEGVETVIEVLKGFSAVLPDLHVTEHVSFGEGDMVAARITMEATHRGEFLGVPATGRRLRWDAIDVCRFVDGKIVEEWAVDDFVGVLRGMGAFTPPWLDGGTD